MAPLVVIVGPTASGKSALAMELTEVFSGEIICSDSRTVYKGMNIGTTKPSVEDRARVPHWGLDLVDPGELFTAADFKQYAVQKIDDIRSRGHVPFMVGGTGLYVDGVVFDYEFQPVDHEKRAALNLLSLEQLKKYCIENNITLPENEKNKRHLIAAIERQNTQSKRRGEPIPNTIIVGITTEKEILRQRIHDRSEHLFESGMVEEAKMLGEKYGWDSEAMTGNIYRLVHEYVEGNMSKDELKRRNETADWQLAKRQITWLKRNPYIVWLSLDEAKKYISPALAS